VLSLLYKFYILYESKEIFEKKHSTNTSALLRDRVGGGPGPRYFWHGDYEEAMDLLPEVRRQYMLGVISDMSFNRDRGKRYKLAGKKLANGFVAKTECIPIIYASSEKLKRK